MKVVLSIIAAAIVFFFIIAILPFYTVDLGERAIVLHLNNVKEITGPGWHWKQPFTESVEIINVQTQKEEADASAASKDLQTVSAKVALNYSLDPSMVGELYQTVGDMDIIVSKIVRPALQESIKSTTAQFTAEELVTKRAQVREQIITALRERMQFRGINTDDFNIINFDFSSSFNKAIEEKVTAEQEALAAKNKLEQVKYEAQAQIETAKGRAEAIRIESQALTQQPQYIELKKIERWDGRFPTYMGGGVQPFVDVTK